MEKVAAVVGQSEERIKRRRRGENLDDRARHQIAASIGRAPEELPPDAAGYDREFREGLRELRQQTKKDQH